MIKHTVFFKLKHATGSAAEAEFLKAGTQLSKIPGVIDFEVVRQTSKKNTFDFGFLMGFKGEADYQFYNKHPLHVSFVQGRWIPEVEEFLEIDYV